MSLALIWYLAGISEALKIILSTAAGVSVSAAAFTICGIIAESDESTIKQCKIASVVLTIVFLLSVLPAVILPTKDTTKELIVLHYGQEALQSEVFQEKLERLDKITNKALDKVESKLNEEPKNEEK